MGALRGVTDQPITLLKEDLFDVSMYIDALTEFIISCDTPMTISLQGDWGSGKTSIMNMIKDKLEGQVHPIWFNTWQFSQFDIGNDLAFSMMDVMFKGLGSSHQERNKILKGLKRFTKTATEVATDVLAGGKASELAGKVFDIGEETDYAAEIMELKDKFQKEVDKTLEQSGVNRVVIFVDDLDRLFPGKAVELLEILKLFLDCRHCVFILAVDYEVVQAGIKEKFGGDISLEKGRKFFDKIIQLPFRMPINHYNIQQYVETMMKKVGISIENNEVCIYSELISYSTGCNPRSMKRLFNTFQLLDIVSSKTCAHIADDVRKRILFAVICLQQAYEEVYVYLSKVKSDIMLKAFLSSAWLSFDIQCEFEEDDEEEESDDETEEEQDDESDDNEKKWFRDKIITIYPGKTEEEYDQLVPKIAEYLTHFQDALQLDDDFDLSKKELQNLRDIMHSSSVTSL